MPRRSLVKQSVLLDHVVDIRWPLCVHIGAAMSVKFLGSAPVETWFPICNTTSLTAGKINLTTEITEPAVCRAGMIDRGSGEIVCFETREQRRLLGDAR